MADTAEEMGLPVPYARAERVVKERFWWKVRKTFGRVPFMEDALAAYYCATDPATAPRVRAVIYAALAYFILPVDLVPDVLVGLGFTDDATVIATTLAVVGSHIKQEHRARARAALMKPDPQ